MEPKANYGAGCAHHHEAPTFPVDPAAPAPEKFECWGHVEIMGHNQIAGRLSEQSIGGRVMLRVDVPLEDGSFRTEFLGGSAIFRVTPADEAAVRKLVTRMRPEPVFAYMLGTTPRLARVGKDDDEQDFFGGEG
jgi:hypothetical protein